MTTTHDHAPFMDMKDWIPVTHKVYLAQTGVASCCVPSEPDHLVVTVEPLEGGTRVVTWAELCADDADGTPRSVHEPYLCMIYHAEDDHLVLFMRKNVGLALA